MSQVQREECVLTFILNQCLAAIERWSQGECQKDLWLFNESFEGRLCDYMCVNTIENTFSVWQNKAPCTAVKRRVNLESQALGLNPGFLTQNLVTVGLQFLICKIEGWDGQPLQSTKAMNLRTCDQKRKLKLWTKAVVLQKTLEESLSGGWGCSPPGLAALKSSTKTEKGHWTWQLRDHWKSNNLSRVL